MRALYLSNQPYFVTSRTQEGLPMVSTDVMNLIIEGILARALELYQVKLCHYKFLANHFHLMFVVLDPEDASRFVGYLKGEIAHAINRLLDRRNKTVWCAGFDSPILLDPETALDKAVYIYANAARANLVDTVDKYPGVSSWQMFKKGKTSKTCYKLSRDHILPLGTASLGILEQIELRNSYVPLASKLTLELEPDAWVDCFPTEVDREAAKEELIDRVYRLEEEYRQTRQAEGKSVIGDLKLRRQSMAKSYKPSKYSKRMLCHGKSKSIRAPFISLYQELCKVAREVYEAWKLGELSLKIPSGMFSPRPPSLSCCLKL